MDPLLEDRQEPIPSAAVCLEGLGRHFQAYAASIDKLKRENADLRQQLALVLQRLEDANAQAVRYSFLLQEAQEGREGPQTPAPPGSAAPPAPGAQNASPAHAAPQPQPPGGQGTQNPAPPARQAPQGPGSQTPGGIYNTVVSTRQTGIPGGLQPSGKAAVAPAPLGALPRGRGEAPTCTPLASYVIHNRAVHTLIFASNYLITSSRDGSTRGWVLPPEAVGKLNGVQGTPAAVGVALRTYRCDSPVLAAALVDGRLLVANARRQILIYASPVRCLEASAPYADVSSVDQDIIRPDKHKRALTLAALTWCFCPAPGGLLCLGGGYCSYLAVSATSYQDALSVPIRGPDASGPFRDELLLPVHVASLGQSHFMTVRERYADPGKAMRGPGDLPTTPQELQGLERTGFRLFRLAPASLAAAASGASGAAGEAAQVWDHALRMSLEEMHLPAPLQPTGLVAMSPLEGTSGILLASTTCPAAKLVASDGASLLRCELPDSPPSEAFSAIAVLGGRLYATPFCGDGESPKLNVYSLDADSRSALKEIASRAVSAAKARPVAEEGERESLPPLLFGDTFPALHFCLVGSFVLDGLSGSVVSLAARGSYNGKLAVVAAGGRDGEVCIKGISV